MCISNIEDLITFIVNNQILTRRWRVIYDKNYLVSNNYPFPHHVSYLRLSKFSNYLDKFFDVFRKLRMDFIDNKIMRVLEHHTVGLTGPNDTIEEGVRGKRKREQDQFLTSQIQIDSFSFVEHHNAGKATVIMSNPVAKNSCSFE